MFGTALAALDGAAPDPELFYCAALLHDWGLESITAGQDFTIAGAERAQRAGQGAGLGDGDISALRDAITLHANPSVDPSLSPVGAYVSAGALLDISGLRLWDVSGENVTRVLRRHPRARGFKTELNGLIRAEARANPQGRFALYRACGLGVMVSVAPLRHT